MLQAIETKIIAATNHRGTRIKASCERGSITISYPYEMNTAAAHVFAAQCLVNSFLREDEERFGPQPKNPWAAPRVSGWLSDSCVHVLT